MLYNQINQYIWCDRIMSAVCEIGEVSFIELSSPDSKAVKLSTLRGIFCYITRDMCIHPDRAARLICRTRQNVINQARKYAQYIQMKDKYTLGYYNKIMNILNRYNQ